MLRQLVVGVFVVIAVGFVSVGTAPPAGACTCDPPIDEEAIEAADAAFTGSLVDVVASTGADVSSADPERFVFDVQDVFKGEVTARQTVVTPRGGASCGLEISGPGPYLVFAFDDSQLTSGAEAGELYSHLCSGTRPLSDGEVPVDFVSTPPVSTENPPLAPDQHRESASTVADGGDGGLWMPVAIGAGGLLLVSAVIWWLRARPRSKPRT